MSKKRQLILALGTNHHRQENMRLAQAHLHDLLRDIEFSSSALTAAIGEFQLRRSSHHVADVVRIAYQVQGHRGQLR